MSGGDTRARASPNRPKHFAFIDALSCRAFFFLSLIFSVPPLHFILCFPANAELFNIAYSDSDWHVMVRRGMRWRTTAAGSSRIALLDARNKQRVILRGANRDKAFLICEYLVFWSWLFIVSSTGRPCSTCSCVTDQLCDHMQHSWSAWLEQRRGRETIWYGKNWGTMAKQTISAPNPVCHVLGPCSCF